VIIISVTAAVDAAGTLRTFYASTDRFVTQPTDTPPSTFMNPSVIDPGSLGLSTFSDGRTSGSTRLETGEVVLANADGQYDEWVSYSFDGRPITVYSGEQTAAFPSGFTKIFTGTMESITASWDTVVIKIRDKQYIFSLPLLTTKYAGTNVLPEGIEGTATDIKGDTKPRVYGKVFNVPCVPVNTSRLIYQISDGPVQAINAVYDKGAAFSLGVNYATSALLQSNSPSSGSYNTCTAEGLFRLGSTPAGVITADVTQGATAADRTVAQIVKSVAMSAGLSVAEVSAADVTTMDAANSSVVGIYIDDESSFQECLDQLLNSIGAYCGFDSNGVLRMGVLTQPSGTAVVTLQEFDLKDVPERKTPADNGLPVHQVSINHSKIYTVQGSDIAGSVGTSTRAFLEKEYRSAVATDSTVKTQWLLAGEIKQDTLLTTEAAAIAEADRQLGLYKVRRDLYEVAIDLSLFTISGLKLLDIVEMNVPRFSLMGTKFRMIGYRLEIEQQTVRCTLWG
jgi:hypothetical protein